MDRIDSGNGWPNEEQTWLLQAALFSGHLAQEAWGKWVERVDFDKIDPASYKLLPLVSRSSALEALRDPIFEKCKGVYRQVWVANRLQWKKLLPTFAEFLKAGVSQIVLLKGMAMILRFYQDFGVRVIGDVDVLIKREELPIVDPLLDTLGWERVSSHVDLKNPGYLDRWHALNLTHEVGMNLDLHWSFIHEHSSVLDEAVLKGAQSVSVEDVCLYVPNPTDLLLQTCVHGVKHSPVPLIRWVADAVTILKHAEKEIDWERLVDLAGKAHICIPISSALQYLREQFAAPIPESAVQKLRKIPSARIESLEYRANTRGACYMAAWYRYCLNRDCLSRGSQIKQIHKYLQHTARLKSPWYIPFFAVYWVFKRLFRMVVSR